MSNFRLVLVVYSEGGSILHKSEKILHSHAEFQDILERGDEVLAEQGFDWASLPDDSLARFIAGDRHAGYDNPYADYTAKYANMNIQGVKFSDLMDAAARKYADTGEHTEWLLPYTSWRGEYNPNMSADGLAETGTKIVW